MQTDIIPDSATPSPSIKNLRKDMNDPYAEIQYTEFRDNDERQKIGKMWIERKNDIMKWREDQKHDKSINFPSLASEARKQYNGQCESGINQFFQSVETIASNLHQGKPKPYVEGQPADDSDELKLNRKMADIIRVNLNCQLDNGKLNTIVSDHLINYLVDGFSCIKTEVIPPSEHYPEYRLSYDALCYEQLYIPKASCWEDVSFVIEKIEVTKEPLELLYDTKFKDSSLAAMPDSDYAEEENKEADNDKFIVWKCSDWVNNQVLYIRDHDSVCVARINDPHRYKSKYSRPIIYSRGKDMIPIPMWNKVRTIQKDIDAFYIKVMETSKGLAAKAVHGFEASDEGGQKKAIQDMLTSDKPGAWHIEGISQQITDGKPLEAFFAYFPIDKAQSLIEMWMTQIEVLQNKMDKELGVPDIMQGLSNPQEGVKTQMIKANFALARLSPQIMDFNLSLTDVMQNSAELIHRFPLNYLAMKAGIDLTRPENVQLQQRFESQPLLNYSVDIDTKAMMLNDIEETFAKLKLLEEMNKSYREQIMTLGPDAIKDKFLLTRRHLHAITLLDLPIEMQRAEEQNLTEKLNDMEKQIDKMFDPSTGDLTDQGRDFIFKAKQEKMAMDAPLMKAKNDKDVKMAVENGNKELKILEMNNQKELKMADIQARVEMAANSDAVTRFIAEMQNDLKNKELDWKKFIEGFEAKLEEKMTDAKVASEAMERRLEALEYRNSIQDQNAPTPKDREIGSQETKVTIGK